MKNDAEKSRSPFFGSRPPGPMAQLRSEIEDRYRAKAIAKQLLLADDDDLSIELFEQATQGWRYDLTVANSVRSTQAVLERMDPLAGAVLDAVFMNGSGIQVYLWIAKHRPNLKVAFLTNYPGPQMQDLVRDIGPAIVFNKDMIGDETAVAKLMLLFGIQRRTLKN